MMWTDDPVRDAARYAAREEERPFITCDICGEKIFCEDGIYEGDEYYQIEVQNICEDCIRKFLRERKVVA